MTNQDTNRDKALRGEVVAVSEGRLLEMQRIAVANEGVGYENYHWHWAAIVNELIARRAVEPSPVHPDTARLDWLERFGDEHGWTDKTNGHCLYIDHVFKAPLREAIDGEMREGTAPKSSAGT